MALIGAIFALFTISLKIYDLGAIGPNGSVVGFSKFNEYMHELIGINMMFYKITDWLGLIPVFLGLFFAFKGLVELTKVRSIL